MSNVIKPISALPQGGFSIFLAGSIEMGKAESWQNKIEKSLENENVNIFNPRRDEWDSSWEQKYENEQFRAQVMWELEALEQADIIAMYFDKLTQSPISLLELGLHAKTGKMIVCCPEGFWRKGNVDTVCKKYNIPQVQTIEGLVEEIQRRIVK